VDSHLVLEEDNENVTDTMRSYRKIMLIGERHIVIIYLLFTIVSMRWQHFMEQDGMLVIDILLLM
jgi:hypothetical protein